MLNADAAVGLAGFLEWSEPVIFDRLRDGYQSRIGVGPAPWKLARLHTRAWRALISGDMSKFESLRWDLSDALVEFHLGNDDVAEADAQILVELLDIVMTRYQHSLRTAKDYHLALIALGARLRAG